jgi:hypothetical protein
VNRESLKQRAERLRVRWEEEARRAVTEGDYHTWRQHVDWIFAIDCVLEDQVEPPDDRIPFRAEVKQ